MDYDTAQNALRNALKGSKIRRKVHWHLFRHTRATLLARDLKEAPLERQMGWIHGSKQTQIYVHLSDQDVDNSVLKAYGVEIKEEKQKIDSLPRICERRKETNLSDAKYCKRCGFPLDISLLNELDEKQTKAISILAKMNLSDTEKSLLAIIKSDPEL